MAAVDAVLHNAASADAHRPSPGEEMPLMRGVPGVRVEVVSPHGAINSPPPQRHGLLVRQQYLERLGYLPLRFKGAVQQQREVTRLRAKLKGEQAAGPSLEHRPVSFFEVPPPGSIRGSIFNLCAATLGAGALSLPYAFAQSGLACGVALLCVAALLTVYSIRLLLDAGKLTGLKSYEDLTLFCFGRGAMLFIELLIVLFCIGIMVAYLVTLGDLITPLGEALFGPGHVFSSRPVLMSLLTVVPVFPLSLMREISGLQVSSLIGVGSILFLVCCVAFRSAELIGAEGLADSIVWGANGGVLLAAPVVLFSFTNQVNIFSIYGELQRPSIRRMGKVVNRSTAVSLLVYLVVGVSAYLAFGIGTAAPAVKGDALLLFPFQDYLIACSKAAITVSIAMAFPMNVFPCRFTVEMMLWPDAPASNARHFLLTAVLVFGSLGLAIYVPSIQVVFGIIGGSCSSIVCFAFPAAFKLQLEPGPVYRRENWAPLALLVGSLVVGALSTGETIYQNFLVEQ